MQQCTVRAIHIKSFPDTFLVTGFLGQDLQWAPNFLSDMNELKIHRDQLWRKKQHQRLLLKKRNNGKVSCSSFHHWVYESVNLKATLLLPIKSISSMKSKQVTKHLDKTDYSYRLFSTLLPILCTYMMHFPWWEDIYVKNVNQLSKSQRDEQILVHENLLRLWDSTRLKEKSI